MGAWVGMGAWLCLALLFESLPTDRILLRAALFVLHHVLHILAKPGAELPPFLDILPPVARCDRSALVSVRGLGCLKLVPRRFRWASASATKAAASGLVRGYDGMSIFCSRTERFWGSIRSRKSGPFGSPMKWPR